MVAVRFGLWALVSLVTLSACASANAAQYAIDGFAIGQPIASSNSNYRSYTCKPSEQFADALDCERTQQRRIGANTVNVSNTLIHTLDGIVIYAVMDFGPVAMSAAAVRNELSELSQTIGEKPASEARGNNDQDVTAVWGTVKLEDIKGADSDTLAAGGSLRLGIPFDPEGNPRLAAEQYLTLARLAGGVGLVYSASSDNGGRVHRRLVAIDPKQIAIRQFRLSLQKILRQDSTLAADDYRLWSDIAWIARNLARDTSVKTATDLLDAGFEQNHSTKLRSHIWPLLPLGAIGRLAAGAYSRLDIYGPETQNPEIRRSIEIFLAEQPSDRFVDFAYYLLGDYEKALQANPNSPIAASLHFGLGYRILQALMDDTLHAIKARFTAETPAEVKDMLDPLLDENPDTEYHVEASLQAANLSWKESDRQPLADLLPSFSSQAAVAQSQFASVMLHPSSASADDAAYLVGWLYLQMGKNDEALESFSRAMVIGNGDYVRAATSEALRILERMPPSQQFAVIRANQSLSLRPPLWYEAARSAYRDFDYARTIEIGKQALNALRIPFDDLPVTTDDDRITEAIEKINPKLGPNVNVTELPYLIRASEEMSKYEAYLKNVSKEPPDAFIREARKIILKYSMLVNPPVAPPGRPKPPPVHRDFRQALHLIDETFDATPREPQYAPLREWMRFRTVRIMVFYAPERVPQTIAALAEEFPGSRLLGDALAEEIFAEGVIMKDTDAAQKTFRELLSKYPNSNAVDNAYSWMAIIMRCTDQLDEEKRLNAEIIRRFPLTRHATYAKERMAHPNACGL
jgi:tetratricopeptide (TPR) repeat protein